MKLEREQVLKHETGLGSGSMFLSFLNELDKKIESYIETVEILNENPGIVRELKKATKGKHYPLAKLKTELEAEAYRPEPLQRVLLLSKL